MGRISIFNVQHWDEQTYTINVISNSSISEFEFSPSLIPEISSKISLKVSGVEGTAGFCRIAIPNIIVQDFWQGNYVVLLNGELWPFKNWTETENTYIYLGYANSQHQIVIIPEFPQAMLLPLFTALSTLAIAITKKRFLKKPKRNA